LFPSGTELFPHIKQGKATRKEPERAQKLAAKRVNLDLPADSKTRLVILAKKDGVPVGRLVAFLPYAPVNHSSVRLIRLWGYEMPSGCRKGFEGFPTRWFMLYMLFFRAAIFRIGRGL